LQGHRLDGIEIYFKCGQDRFVWHDRPGAALRPIDPLHPDNAGIKPNFDALELTGALRTAQLTSPMPRLFC
jgi:hypothetical protein